MKNIRELTDDQAVEIANLALESILNFDSVLSFIKNENAGPIEGKIERELWHPEENLMVIRVYAHGLGDTFCAIWEQDDENRIDVTVVQNKEVDDVDNMVSIVKKLIEWEFV